MKYEYMKESEQMLQYFQFPKFLLKLRISQTAKFLYMILYDRARISRMNSWIDKYGNVYLIFPIEELSAQIGKCKSSVKTALKELDDVGLLVRRSGGFSKPNHLTEKFHLMRLVYSWLRIRRLKRWLQQSRKSNLHLVVKMAVQESEMWHLVK